MRVIGESPSVYDYAQEEKNDQNKYYVQQYPHKQHKEKFPMHWVLKKMLKIFKYLLQIARIGISAKFYHKLKNIIINLKMSVILSIRLPSQAQWLAEWLCTLERKGTTV